MKNYLREKLLQSFLIGIEFGVIAAGASIVLVTVFSLLT